MKGDLVVSKSIASRTDHVQNPMLTWGILCALWIASDNGGSAISENSPMSCVVIAVAILVHTIKTMRFLKKKTMIAPAAPRVAFLFTGISEAGVWYC